MSVMTTISLCFKADLEWISKNAQQWSFNRPVFHLLRISFKVQIAKNTFKNSTSEELMSDLEQNKDEICLLRQNIIYTASPFWQWIIKTKGWVERRLESDSFLSLLSSSAPVVTRPLRQPRPLTTTSTHQCLQTPPGLANSDVNTTFIKELGNTWW